MLVVDGATAVSIVRYISITQACLNLVECFKDGPHVVDSGQLLEKWYVVVEASVVFVLVPRADGKCIVRLEQVGSRRVINN